MSNIINRVASRALEAAKKPTFDEARKAMFELLTSKGWKVNGNLKVPQATSKDGDVRIWFKPQALYLTVSDAPRIPHDFARARSIHTDLRDQSAEETLKIVEKWVERISKEEV